jgi:hypothetical protein
MRVFLYNSETEYEFNDVEDDDDTDLETTLEEFYELSEEGSFLGIVTPDDRTIQFLYQSNDNWLLDIPSKDDPQEKFYQRLVSYDECIQIIKLLFNNANLKEIQKILNSYIL